MSVQIIVAVFDSQMNAFSRPFFVPTTGTAIRSFSDEVNRDAADNIMFHHPEDFALYQIGTFDDVSGELDSETSIPVLLIKAISIKTGA